MTSKFQSNHPLKFYIDYQGLDAYVTVSDEYKKQINEAFLSTTKAFSGLLSVEGADTVLTFDEISYRNSHLELTEEYQTGINADIVIFPIVRTDNDLGSGVIASAKSCYLHSGTNRTIAAVFLWHQIHIRNVPDCNLTVLDVLYICKTRFVVRI